MKNDYNFMVSLFGVLCVSSPSPRLSRVLQVTLVLLLASDLLFLLSFSNIWVTLSPQSYKPAATHTSKAIVKSKMRYFDTWNQLDGLHTMAFIFTGVCLVINAIVTVLLQSQQGNTVYVP